MSKKHRLQVGVTGGIGSGKSLICKIFALLGISVYNADMRGRWLTDHDPEIRNSIVAIFGPSAYRGDQLDRKRIADIVFNNKQKLEALNSIIHPAVAKDYKVWVDDQKSAYVVKEAALMFESSSHRLLDKIITVSAPDELRIKRVLKRDPFRSEKDIKAIIDQQLNEKERIDRSDYVIINDESHMVLPQVLDLHQQFNA